MTPMEDHSMRDIDGLIKSDTSENTEQKESDTEFVPAPQDNGQIQKSDPLAGGLEMLLSNPQLLSSISGIVKNLSSTAEPTAATATPPSPSLEGGLSSLLSNPDVISKIPDIISVISPMLGNSQNSVSAAKTPSKPKKPTDNRAALMAALKPYLNPSRQEALNYLLKLNQLGDILKSLN
ncbi:MAG: hypothetical protein II365_01650 [Clostridia bacterium]|nr:hypothetical protein [Clostridia bacterium]